MHHVSVMDTNLTRDKFTWHGLHLNYSGKERLAKITRQTTTTILTSGNPPISLKWKEIPLATPSIETKMVSFSKNDDGVNINVARSSCRSKRPPVTRSEDFLWVECAPKTG